MGIDYGSVLYEMSEESFWDRLGVWFSPAQSLEEEFFDRIGYPDDLVERD